MKRSVTMQKANPQQLASLGLGRITGAARLSVVVMAIILCAAAPLSAQKTSDNDQQFKKWLQKFPESDANADGVLTESEARAYRKAMQTKQAGAEDQGGRPAADKRARRKGTGGKPELPEGVTKRTEMVSMRDAVRLATDFYLPAGEGPWPVVVTCTCYNRQSGKQVVAGGKFASRGYAYVTQDWRGLFDSEGEMPLLKPDSAIDDGYDTVA